eukprot:s164_g66.t1
MDNIQFLAAFGVNMAKGSHIILQRKALMEDALVKHSRKRESLRGQVVNLLIDLWRIDALPRDGTDKMSRTTELIVKSLLQHFSIPSLDWKKVVQDADEKFRGIPDGREERRHRSRTPARSRPDHRQELPRRREFSAARSKSAARPGDRIALMNTEQRKNGNILETPARNCDPSRLENSVPIPTPRQLFMSPPEDVPNLANLSMVPIESEEKSNGEVRATGDEIARRPLSPMQVHQVQQGPNMQAEPKAFQKFHAQRLKWPPLDPHEILRAQQKPTFMYASSEDVMDFVFHCPEDAKMDKLYLFYRELSKAGVYVDLLYWGSSHHQLINACGFKGSDAVPAVTTKLGPSINLHISTSGRIRLDGRMEHKEILASMLRRVFLPFDQALLSKAPAIPQMQSDNRKLQDWLCQHRGKVLAIDAACLFDGFGVQGVWDKLNLAVGVRGAASNNAIPWLILTRSHVCIAVWPSGKVQISPGKASLAAVLAVESTLVSQFNGQWMRDDEFAASRASNEILLTYGVPSEAARQQLFG